MTVQAILFVLAIVGAYWYWRGAGRGASAGHVLMRVCSMALWIYAALLLWAFATETDWFVLEVTPWWAGAPLIYFVYRAISWRRARV